jgi:hypothetical protein
LKDAVLVVLWAGNIVTMRGERKERTENAAQRAASKGVCRLNSPPYKVRGVFEGARLILFSFNVIRGPQPMETSAEADAAS